MEAPLNRDWRDARRANICLHSDSTELEFSGREYICGGVDLVTYLLGTRARVRVQCTRQRLTDFQRARLTGSTGGDTVTTLVSTATTISNRQKVFLSEYDQFWPELMYALARATQSFRHSNDSPSRGHTNTS